MGTPSTVDRRNISFLRQHQAQGIEVDQLFAKARVGDMPMARNVDSSICFVCVPPMVLRASLATTASGFSFSGGLYPRAKLI
jgi:hypothetical protein